MALLMPTQDPWRKGSEILNLKIGNGKLGFMPVKKETLRAAPLEVDRGDLHAGGPRVLMMLDLCFLNFLQKQAVFLRQICINLSL